MKKPSQKPSQKRQQSKNWAANEAIERGHSLETRGSYSSAAVWYEKAARLLERAGYKAKAKHWREKAEKLHPSRKNPSRDVHFQEWPDEQGVIVRGQYRPSRYPAHLVWSSSQKPTVTVREVNGQYFVLVGNEVEEATRSLKRAMKLAHGYARTIIRTRKR